jgi:predicted nucleic acid-binding protein
MKTSHLVVDTSVLLKWFLPGHEEHQAQALKLRDHFFNGAVKVFLPEYAAYELGNRLSRLPNAHSAYFLDVLQLSGQLVALDRPQLARTFDLAARHQRESAKGLTFYDACFIVLAQDQHCALVTADSPQAHAAAKAGVKVIELKDYE